MIPVTVVIPVKNEELNLPRCLDALHGFYHIVIVDSQSTDSTREIAKAKNIELVDFQWNGRFPKKRNWLLRNYEFSTDWVLFLDADEIVSEEFKNEVKTAIGKTEIDGYWLNFHNFFQGRLLKRGILFRKLALFRVGKGEYEQIEETRWSNLDMEIHEHPIINGPTGEIKSPIVHYDYKGLYHYLARHNEYSSWEAQRFFDLRKNNSDQWAQRLTPRQRKKYRSLDKWWWAPAYFFTNYIIRLGFLDGRGGFVFSFLKAVYFFEVRCKIKEIGKSGING
jgi:glycosyltransferase involved in cell wall biosynthesis